MHCMFLINFYSLFLSLGEVFINKRKSKPVKNKEKNRKRQNKAIVFKEKSSVLELLQK